VMLYAPSAEYGTPEELKELVDTAHAKGLMVFLDVVYNHFGPESDFLDVYAPQFFSAQHRTPWGRAINYDGPESETVRDFFVHNSLYWLEEFHFDGLRLDAVDTIRDQSSFDILIQIAESIRRGPGSQRLVHLVLENDKNGSRYARVKPMGTTAIIPMRRWPIWAAV
jgi:maltooligosyltrehalose trehalohydrolase